MGRKTNMPRPPDILRKGGGHRDRRRDAEDNWLQRQIDIAERELDALPTALKEQMFEYRGPSHRMGPDLIRGLMDNQTQQEDTDA